MFLTTFFPLLLMYRISYLGLIAKCFRGSLFLQDFVFSIFVVHECLSLYSDVFS